MNLKLIFLEVNSFLFNELIDEINSLIGNAYYDKGDYEEAAKLGHKGAQEKINKEEN